MDDLRNNIRFAGILKGEANIVDGLLAIATALDGVAIQIKYLGNGDAAGGRGAIEAYGMYMGGKIDRLIEVLGGDPA